MKIELKPRAERLSDEELLEDLRRVARLLKKPYLSGTAYDEHGRVSHDTVARRFDSWRQAVGKAGLRPAKVRNIDENDLFYNLLAVWVKLGRQPVIRELRQPLSKFTVGPYKQRFGTWQRVLKAFIAWLRWVDQPEDAQAEPQDRAAAPAKAGASTKPKTSRPPSLRQRFRVMLRDHFRCRLCGRSPATCLGLQLVIDHVVPWSKGGETTDDNLQTLCSDCNQGKFDHNGKQPSDEVTK